MCPSFRNTLSADYRANKIMSYSKCNSNRELIVHFRASKHGILCWSDVDVAQWRCLSVEVSLVSRHIKRTCIQYNNKLRAQHLRPLLDTDCRIKTNPIKQIGPLPLAQRMHAGGAQLGLLGGCSLMCWVSVTVECSAQTSLSSHVSMTGVYVCVGQGVVVEIKARAVVCVYLWAFFCQT